MSDGLNIPLTGSTVAGPLGLVHLPRMWQKALLHARAALPDDYIFVSRGFDQRIVEDIGLDPDAFLPFLATAPSYLATEAWVCDHATNLDALGTTNDFILNRRMSPEGAAKLRAAIGTNDAALDNGALLNAMDDWMTLHRYVVAHRGQALEPIVPAVSSLASGPLGLLHLPRLWAKAVIKAVGALPEGYNSGKGPIDEQLAQAIGMDLAESVRFTSETLPSYLDYEQWVREHATTLNPTTIAAWNELSRTREKPAPLAAGERALIGLDNENERRGALLSDLVDWHLWHDQLLARP